MFDEIDTGERCTDHVGELFRVRCAACDAERDGAVAAPLTVPRCGFIPGSECATHRNYVLPCAACSRQTQGEQR